MYEITLSDSDTRSVRKAKTWKEVEFDIDAMLQVFSKTGHKVKGGYIDSPGALKGLWEIAGKNDTVILAVRLT